VNGNINSTNGFDMIIDNDEVETISLTKESANIKVINDDYVVYVDNCADVSGTSNKHLLTQIKPVKSSIGGIDKSQPRLITDGKGTFLGAFDFHLSKNFRQNIWSEGAILTTPGWKMRMNEETNDKTIIDPNGREFVFTFNKLRWSRDFSKDFEQSILAIGDSVETELQNEQMYTKDEVVRARAAGVLIRRLGFPSIGMLIPMIERGIFNNCPVTASDVLRCLKISDKVFISYYKGKATHRSISFDKPITVPRLIEKAQALYFDIMFIVKIGFVISSSKPMNLVTATPIGAVSGVRSVSNLREAIKQHINVYAKHGFTVKEIHSDAEGGFTAQQPWLASLGIRYTPNPGDVKVGIAENAIKQVKNTARCILHSVPYHLSLVLLVWLVCYSVYCINLQTSRTGREGLCPRQELTGIRPDAKRDIRAGYGDGVITFNKNAGNSLEAKGTVGIALLPSGNQQGSWKILSLLSGKTTTSNQFKIIPLPREYIDLLNNWAKLRADLPDELSSTWGHYLATEEEGEEGLDIDRSLPELIRKYRIPMVDVDMPRISEPEVEIPFSSVAPVTPESQISINQKTVFSGPQQQAAVTASERATARQWSGVPAAADSGVPTVESGVPAADDTSSEQLPDSSHGGDDSAAEEQIFAAEKLAYCTVVSASDGMVYGDNDGNGPCIFQMSLSQSIEMHGEKAEKAAIDEIMQLHRKPMWIGVPPKEAFQIPKKFKIHSKLFMKEKFNTNRELEKIKGRLVSRGDQVSEELREYIESPTVSAEAVFILLSIFAMEGREWASYDVPAAYTNAKRNPNSNPVYMILNKDITKIIVDNDPSFEEFINVKGSSLVKVVRAAYGLSDSSGLWFLEVSNYLKEIGFKENPVVPCVFNKIIDGYQATILLYVDDMLIAH
jgi:hypothetical protein